MMIPGILGQRRHDPPAWSPASVIGLRSWLVADNPANTLVSGELSVIADKSGNGASATASASIDRATLVASGLGGRTIWRSDSTTKKGTFVIGDQTISQNAAGVTLAVVHRTNPAQELNDLSIMRININGSIRSRAMIGRGSYAANGVYAGGRRLDADSYDGANDNTNYSNAWLIIVASFNYATGTVVLSVNGVETVDSAFHSPGNTSDTTSLNTSIGRNNGSGASSSIAYGDYAEALIYRAALDSTDRRKLEGYLASQWGLQGSLPVDHPYKNTAP